MTDFPDFPKTLLKFSSLFATPGWQAAERDRFAAIDMRSGRFTERTYQLLDNIREALSLPQDHELWSDFTKQLHHFGEQLDVRALHTATFGADERQILWALGRDLAPGLGRTWGFWCRDEAIMPELPGTDLWFLPRADPDRPERLVLPVAVIARWWRSLLEGPLESIWHQDGADRHRTFQTWLAGQATPTPRKLEEWFSDVRKFRYRAEIADPPETRTVRTLLLWARAIETGWKDLVAVLTPDLAPDDADPMRNKALQLVELFRLAHQLTVAPETNDPLSADRMFLAAVPEWLACGPFRPILPAPDGRLPAAKACAGWMSAHFRSLVPGAPLQDIFRDAAMDAPSTPVVEPAILGERQKLEALLVEGHAARQSKAHDRASKVEEALAQASAHPRSADMEADIQLLAALDTISKGDFDAAREILDRGLELCSKGGFGAVRLEMARLRLALSVAGEAFNQNRCEADFRVLSRSIPPEEADRWEIGKAPLEHSIRLAAVDLSAKFWENRVRLYPGAIIEHPLEESAPIFKAYVRLLLEGAEEQQIRGFLADHRGILKRKLRDVRGDTFFTMMTKMVLDRGAKLRAFPPDVYSHGHSSTSSPQALAVQIHETHLQLARLLPTDVLNARDYRGQTALMLAADRKDAKLVQTLIDRRVDLDAQDTLGRTAMHSAVRANAEECFKLLLAAGANPALRTFEGKTPAIFAAEFGRATIFRHRLRHTIRAMTQEELQEANSIAARNERAYKKVRTAYRMLGVELGGRQAFKEIISISSAEL